MALDLFQFHNGSIKRLDVHDLLNFLPTFQFHNGSIKSSPFLYRFDMILSVSIPQWFD